MPIVEGRDTRKIMNEFDDHFFREAALRICGSFEIEKALQRCLLYIKEFLPIEGMMLNIYDNNTNLAEIIAYADTKSSRSGSLKIPYTMKVKDDMANYQSRSKRIWRVRRMGAYEGTKTIAGKYGFMDSPAVIMDLVIENQIIGKLTILHEKNTEYTD